MSAFYTATSSMELSGKPTKHPVRGVLDGDTAFVFGENQSTFSAWYDASLVGSPVESLPDSVASDGVQWDLSGYTYSDGGIPDSLQCDIVPVTLPDIWAKKSVDNNLLYERIAGKKEDNYNGAGLWEKGGVLWLLHGSGVQSFDLNNNNESKFYQSPIFPGESSIYSTYKHASSLCMSTGVIHLVGGTDSPQRYHHTFDTNSGQFLINNLDQVPVAVTGAHLLDASLINGNLYLLTDSIYAFRYNMQEDQWYTIAELSIDAPILKVIPDYQDSNSFIVLFNTYELMRFNAWTESWSTVGSLAGDGFSFSLNRFAAYDVYSERYFFIKEDDITYYDPILNEKTIDIGNTNIKSKFFYPAPSIHIGNGYHVTCNCYDEYSLVLISAIPSIKAEKVNV